MHRFITALTAVFLYALPLQAGISLTATGGGLGTVNVYEGLVVYSNFDFAGPQTFEGTVISKSFDSLAPINLDVGFEAGDLDFSGTFNGGFRWSESVTNDTGSFVSGLLLQLDANSTATFLDINATPPQATKIVPTYAIVTPGGTPTVTRDTAFPGGLSLSSDGKQLMFFFNAPLAPSQQVQIHVPINNLDGQNSFSLTQQLIPVVPEPSNLAIWSILGTLGVAVSVIRKR